MFLNLNLWDRLLDHSFQKSGAVLQDIINELGRRLEYSVESGLYQGKTNAIGFDGIWEAPDGFAFVIEVKTTDAYRMNLDKIAEYRDKLIGSGRISTASSIVIVVGREDTGDVEAQVRGSRHAWDIRLLSTDALIKLVALKESADEDETIAKIRSVLVPFEYTRLDNIIDVMFTAAKDVEAALGAEAEPSEGPSTAAQTQVHTPPPVMDELRKRIIDALASRENSPLIAHKRAQFWSPDHKVRAVCSISKRYEDQGGYWYAYHPSWDDFLSGGEQSFHVLGCLDKEIAYALPHHIIREQLDYLYKTIKDDRYYWHIHLDDTGGDAALKLRGNQKLPLSHFELPIPPSI